VNLAAAQRIADAAAQTVVSTTLPCGAPETGLIVLVLRDDSGEMMQGVEVLVSGTAGTTTDANGMASFVPIGAAPRDVQIGTIPDADVVCVAPALVRQPVGVGECPVRVLQIAVRARPAVSLTLKYAADRGVPGATISIGANQLPGVTNGAGLVTWPTSQPPLALGAADVTFTFAAGAYQIFAGDGAVIAGTPRVQLTAGKATYPFTAVPLVPLRVGVTRPRAGAADVYVTGASVTVKWPVGAASRTVASAESGTGVRVTVADVPAMTGDTSTCVLEALAMPDAVDDAPAFEFVSLTPV
jgi:hypothetical protein